MSAALMRLAKAIEDLSTVIKEGDDLRIQINGLPGDESNSALYRISQDQCADADYHTMEHIIQGVDGLAWVARRGAKDIRAVSKLLAAMIPKDEQ